MHHKFAILDKVNVLNQMIEVDKTWQKLRWYNYRRNPRNNVGSTPSPTQSKNDTEDDSTFEEHLFNPITKTLDLSTVGPKNLPFNKWVYGPPPHNPATEAHMVFEK